jgi:hypothetical protein
MTDERQYPITPTPEDDPRCAAGLLHDVARVLEQHGYPRITHGRDLLDLQSALYAYLYTPRERP